MCQPELVLFFSWPPLIASSAGLCVFWTSTRYKATGLDLWKNCRSECYSARTHVRIHNDTKTSVNICQNIYLDRLSEQVGHEISHQLKLHAGLHVRIYANLVVREETARLHVE